MKRLVLVVAIYFAHSVFSFADSSLTKLLVNPEAIQTQPSMTNLVDEVGDLILKPVRTKKWI